MISRRGFLGSVASPGLCSAFLDLGAPERFEEALHTTTRDPRSALETVDDESFWRPVQQAFAVDRSMINLNNGGVSPAPNVVFDRLEQRLRESNDAPPYSMWRVLAPGREVVRRELAAEFGCSPAELAITRNTTESLMACQHGIDLEAGDEVLTTDLDYPRMLQAFHQRERRDGITVRKIELPVPNVSDDDVVERFASAIGDRTKVILVCHVINLTGQILPVRRICDLARERGIRTIVDGAHAIAHFPFRIDELGCDCYGTSLHKWLFAPIGTGLLYVRRERIRELWPLFAAREAQDDDIRKFEEIGTHPIALPLGAAEALLFHRGLGAERKIARLCWLRDRWTAPLLEHDRVRLHTDIRPGRAGAIATVQVEGIPSAKLCTWLWSEHRILTTPIVHPRFEGLRVSPSVYTTPAEIDRFVEAMKTAIVRGI